MAQAQCGWHLASDWIDLCLWLPSPVFPNTDLPLFFDAAMMSSVQQSTLAHWGPAFIHQTLVIATIGDHKNYRLQLARRFSKEEGCRSVFESTGLGIQSQTAWSYAKFTCSSFNGPCAVLHSDATRCPSRKCDFHLDTDIINWVFQVMSQFNFANSGLTGYIDFLM